MYDLTVQSYAAVWSEKDLSRPVAAQELIWQQPHEEVDKTAHIHRITPALSEQGIRPIAAAMMLRLFLQSARRQFRSAPLVLFNAPYDISMLSVQNAKLGEVLTGFNIVDPMIIDRELDRYRKGRRNQSALARHYDCATEEELSAAHDAAVDCRILARIAVNVVEKFRLTEANPDTLHSKQSEWYARQRDSFASYRGESPDSNQQFPIHTQALSAMRDGLAAQNGGESRRSRRKSRV